MSKPLDARPVDFLYDTKWLVQWNIPIQDNQSNEGVAGYNHNVIVFFDVQGPNKEVYGQNQKKFSFHFSDDRLSLPERFILLSSKEVQQKILDEIAKSKLALSGYTYK